MTADAVQKRWVEPYTPPCRRNAPPRRPLFVPRRAPMVSVDEPLDARKLPTLEEIYEAMRSTRLNTQRLAFSS
jgi:hypothetical protein